MAVTPLTNPIAATPLASGAPNAVDDRAQEQRAALTPENIGEAINQQFAGQVSAAAQEAAALVQQSQSNQQVQQLQEQIAAMRREMATVQQQPAQPAQPAPPPPDFSLSESELAEMGANLPGAIDKRANAAAHAMREQIIADVRSVHEQELNALRQEIQALKGDVSGTQAAQGQNFQAQALAQATMNGLDVNVLAADADWQSMMNEVADPIAGTTFGQYYDHAFKTQNAVQIGKLFNTFASRRQQAAQATPTAAPAPIGGAARAVPADPTQATPDAQAQLDQIRQERATLNDQRQRRVINGQMYAQQVAVLDQRLSQLQTSISQPT